jgi:integrase
MAMIDLPYINLQKNRRGEIAYAYYRRNGQRVRLEDHKGAPLLPGQAGFLDAYDRIHQRHGGMPSEVRTGTIAQLVAKFRASAAFNNRIGRGSREQYSYHLRFLEQEFGDLRACKMTAEIVADLLDDFQDTPRKANYLRATISRLWNFGRIYSEFRINENPAEIVERLKEGDGYRAWTDIELAQFMAKAQPMMQVAGALAVYSGQRRSDLARMRWSQYDGSALEVVQQKTGNKVWIRAHSQLRAVLATHPRSGVTILTSNEGRAFSAPWLGRSFGNAVRSTGLPRGSEGCHLHGLRKTAGVKLAEAGCSAHEIMAILGCSMQNADHYCKHAQQKVLATSAIAKLERARRHD